jgi:hypothetical protein
MGERETIVCCSKRDSDEIVHVENSQVPLNRGHLGIENFVRFGSKNFEEMPAIRRNKREEILRK